MLTYTTLNIKKGSYFAYNFGSRWPVSSIPYPTGTIASSIHVIPVLHPVLLIICFPANWGISSIILWVYFPSVCTPIGSFESQTWSLIQRLPFGVKKSGWGPGSDSNQLGRWAIKILNVLTTSLKWQSIGLRSWTIEQQEISTRQFLDVPWEKRMNSSKGPLPNEKSIALTFLSSLPPLTKKCFTQSQSIMWFALLGVVAWHFSWVNISDSSRGVRTSLRLIAFPKHAANLRVAASSPSSLTRWNLASLKILIAW